MPGSSNFSSSSSNFTSAQGAPTQATTPKPCTQCEIGKYRPGVPTFECLSKDDRCPCSVKPVGAQSGSISITGEQYGLSQTCEWMMHGGSGVEVHVRAVDVEQFYDFVHILGCTSPACLNATELGTFTGRLADGEATFQWPNYLKIVFRTDGSVAGQGFVADFRIQTPDSCTDCPAYSKTAVQGSNTVFNCKCLPGFDGPDGGPCIWCRDCKCHDSCAMCKCDEVCNECRCAPGFELDFARVNVEPGSEYAPTPLTDGCPVPGACSCQSFTAFQGSFSDGSKGWLSNPQGNEAASPMFVDGRYLSNSRCRWMIAPPGVKSIRMSLLPGSQAMTHMCPMSHMSIALSIRMSLHPGSQVMMKESVTVSLNCKP